MLADSIEFVTDVAAWRITFSVSWMLYVVPSGNFIMLALPSSSEVMDSILFDCISMTSYIVLLKILPWDDCWYFVYSEVGLFGTTDKGKGISGQLIEFDVSVLATEESKEGEKGGILVAIANIGIGKSNEETQMESNQFTHKLKFRVFVTEE